VGFDLFKDYLVGRKIAFFGRAQKDLFVDLVIKIVVEEIFFFGAFVKLVFPMQVLAEPVRLVNLEHEHYIRHTVCLTHDLGGDVISGLPLSYEVKVMQKDKRKLRFIRSKCLGMEKRERQQDHGGFHRIVMVGLLKEGPLTVKELEEKTTPLSLHFRLPSEHQEHRRRRKESIGLEAACNELVNRKLLCLNQQAKYELTDAGKRKAERTIKLMDKGANVLENQFLSPSAAARNTIFGYAFMSALKLATGLIGGSVGLIADGADTSVDTASAGVVWLGIRFKRELLGTVAIIALMFATAATLVYESATSLLENFRGVVLPLAHPYVIIIVEGIALIAAFGFSFYQRFVGKRSRSLALISQSIDSKNSVYSATAVIIGAVFSIFGVYWVDAVVGSFIAVRITWDSFGLTREAYRAFKGKETDFGKYKMPFENQIHAKREETFRTWILYAIREEKINSEQDIVASLEKTFRPKYMPALFSEFVVGREYDFKGNFNELVKPLIEDTFVLESNGTYALTDKGRNQLKNTLGTLRYKQSELLMQ
jgi:hypothetical protein